MRAIGTEELERSVRFLNSNNDYDLACTMTRHQCDDMMTCLALADMDFKDTFVPSTENEVFDMLELMAKTIQVEIPEGEGLVTYYVLLNAYPFSVLKQAAIEVLSTHRYRTMPLPADILDCKICRSWRATQSWWNFMFNHQTARLKYIKGTLDA